MAVAAGWPRAEWGAAQAAVCPATETVAAEPVVAEQAVSATAAPEVLGRLQNLASGPRGPRRLEDHRFRWRTPAGRLAVQPVGGPAAGVSQVAVGVGS
ncbi:hypothetical protein B1T45_00755 [Mycobacterium kansasii]|uniref:Uncharacterized protein n=1 Tax=Mycobacterium kansasii ATCC 12478 TaxID=557599 RepID=U5X2Z7_MYCKA|nr:hypothetical protein MKAN_28415 [Mycobacterium kansasii ATCC 12478]ARG54630.1 hypothetical protein B1T43_00735 [Mycobacterium kansasii]ARG60079.1 hypothetical protein B1T45_00755 [Mycobacterium kansasii]ARG67819.1 hypothetical protein B1T47_00855 [Mycobacterium kansasii]ARG77669.1 hypothetical protein B1T51_27970 [Mycobacterium kansasii]